MLTEPIIKSADVRRTPSYYTSARLPDGTFIMVPHFRPEDRIFATLWKIGAAHHH